MKKENIRKSLVELVFYSFKSKEREIQNTANIAL
jgi:hypothetical protein